MSSCKAKDSILSASDPPSMVAANDPPSPATRSSSTSRYAMCRVDSKPKLESYNSIYAEKLHAPVPMIRTFTIVSPETLH